MLEGKASPDPTGILATMSDDLFSFAELEKCKNIVEGTAQDCAIEKSIYVKMNLDSSLRKGGLLPEISQ